ncbi:MAG: iron-sulfur cluster repair di-iron protein, ric [Clostridiales bacterium]|nr:iron-sulfur cluster repair di-iron protein, ric [Clostridiales bacterium]
MSNKLTFNEVKEKNLGLLVQYVPVVARVHGDSHPEFHKVHKEFNSLVSKISKAGTERPELDDEFAKLREITGNYKIPNDVCETYEAVYKMISELDEAYNA